MYDPYAELEKHVLPNGLEVYSVFWDRPWIKMGIVVHSGAREDSSELPGLAYFVEHCLRENIPGRELKLSRRFFERLGSTPHFGSTDYLSTTYGCTVPTVIVVFREALAIFGSMLLNAKFEKHIDKYHNLIHRKFQKTYLFDEKLEWDICGNAALFSGHRLETYNGPMGRPEGFLSISAEDLQSFYDKHYVPANMSLVIVGGIRTEELLTEISWSPFSAEKRGEKNQRHPYITSIPQPAEHKRTIKLPHAIHSEVDQVEYATAWAFPSLFPRQTRTVFMNMLSDALCNEMSEKRSFEHGTRVSFTDFGDIGKLSVTSQIESGVVPIFDSLVKDCISSIATRFDLFDHTRGMLAAQCLMADLSGSSLILNACDDLTLDHRVHTLEEEYAGFQEVAFEQMQEVASFLSPEQQFTLILHS